MLPGFLARYARNFFSKIYSWNFYHHHMISAGVPSEFFFAGFQVFSWRSFQIYLKVYSPMSFSGFSEYLYNSLSQDFSEPSAVVVPRISSRQFSGISLGLARKISTVFPPRVFPRFSTSYTYFSIRIFWSLLFCSIFCDLFRNAFWGFSRYFSWYSSCRSF